MESQTVPEEITELDFDIEKVCEHTRMDGQSLVIKCDKPAEWLVTIKRRDDCGCKQNGTKTIAVCRDCLQRFIGIEIWRCAQCRGLLPGTPKIVSIMPLKGGI